MHAYTHYKCTNIHTHTHTTRFPEGERRDQGEKQMLEWKAAEVTLSLIKQESTYTKDHQPTPMKIKLKVAILRHS